VLLCDEYTPTQLKAFRSMVNRSVSWADRDEDLLSLGLLDLNSADFDLSLTGFDPGEIAGCSQCPTKNVRTLRRRCRTILHPAQAIYGFAGIYGDATRAEGATAVRQQLTL
jgi:hypothetical protein